MYYKTIDSSCLFYFICLELKLKDCKTSCCESEKNENHREPDGTVYATTVVQKK